MANRLAGLVVTINGDTTGLSKALSGINTTIKTTTSQLKDVERLLKLDPTNTTLLSQKQETLATKIGATKEKLDALKTAQEQAKAQMDSGDLGKDKYDALQREIVATEQELKNLAREAAEANTALNKIDAVGKTLENVGGKMTAVGSTLTRNVTAPIVGLGTAAVKTTADFDTQMSKVSAISGATGDDFDALRAKAREMGAKTKFSATEAGQGFEYMAMAGWKTGDMLDGIEGIMNLAAASGEDLGTTSDIVTDALTAFGLEAKDSGHFADLLAKTSASANTNVSMLGESFKYAAPVAGALGSSAEDTTLALGLMANSGIKASQAGTALRTGLSNMVKPSKQMQAAMDKYNIALVKNKDGSIDLKGTMEMLRDRLGGVSQDEQAAAASAIFGKNAMSGWLAIINASDKDFDSLSSAIDNCDGSAEEMANKMQDNLAGQITILKSALQELAIQIGDALMPTIRNIVSHIQSFVEKLQQMDEGTRNTIIKIAAFAAAIGPVLLVVGKLTTGIGQGMQAFSSMGRAVLTFVNQAKLGVGMGGKLAAAIGGISAPVLAVIAVVAVLVAAFVHLWKTNEDFRNKITGIWEGIKAKFAEAAEKITSAINALGFNFKDLGEAISAAWDWLCNALEPIITTIFANIGRLISGVIDIVSGVVQVICGLITGFRDGDWTLFLDGLKSIWDGIWTLLSAPVRAVIDVIGGYLEKASTSWGKIWTGVKDFFSSVWRGIKDFFVGIWNAISNTVSTVVGGISRFISSSFNAIKSTFSNIWNAISGVVSSAWETIKNVVQVGLMLIGEIISAAFSIITIPFRFIWENCKDTVTSLWEGIKTAVSNALNAIKTAITNAWNAIWSVLSPILNTIKSGISAAWEGIKTAVSTVLTGIQTAVTTAWNAIWTAVSGVLNTIKTGVSTAWEGIKTAVSTALTAIQTAVVTAWNAIWTALSPILNTIKTGISTAWNGIKTSLTTVLNGIKTAVTGAWNGIKAALTPILNGIKSAVSSAWNGIKTSVTSVVNGIKSAVTTAWNGIKTSVSSVVNGIKSSVGTAWNGIKTSMSSTLNSIKSSVSSVWNGTKTSVSTAINGIKSSVSTGFNAAKSSASSVFNSVKTTVTNAMNGAKNAVTNAVSAIKNKFNFSWSLPHLKLPHVSISGSFSLNPPKVPHFSISWYKKAMQDGMILNGPTIFGQSGNTLLAGGEAGPEAVVGTQSLMEMIRNAVASMANQTTINYGGVNINLYAQPNQDIRELADEIEYRISNNIMRRRAAIGT